MRSEPERRDGAQPEDAAVTGAVSENIDAVAAFYAREERKISLSRNVIERVIEFVGRPIYLGCIVAFVALWSASKIIGNGNPYIKAVFWVLIYGVLVVILMRFGLFATVVTLFVVDTVLGLLGTTDFMSWYGLSSVVLLALIAGLSLYGFRLSLGGQKLIKDPV